MLFACYEDDSTLRGSVVFDDFEITANIKDSIYIYLGDPIKITPEIKGVEGGEYTYQWAIGTYELGGSYNDVIETQFENISTEKELSTVVDSLGHYHIRLTVSNESVSNVKYFEAFVNAEFEEGFLILGKGTDGNNSISFMRTLTPTEEEQGLEPQFVQNSYSKTNGGEVISGDAIDITKMGNFIFIVERETQKVTRIEAKTFQKVNEYDLTKLDADFDPVGITYNDNGNVNQVFVPSRNGGVAKLLPLQFDLFWFSDYPTNVNFSSMISRMSSGGYGDKRLFLDENNNFWSFGWVGMPTPGKMDTHTTYFADKEIVNYFYADEQGSNNDSYVVSKKTDGKTYLSRLYDGFGTNPFDIPTVKEERELTENIDKLTADSKCHTNDIYACLFFNSGREVYKWFFNQNQIPAEPLFTLPEGEEIVIITSYGYSTALTAPSGDQTEVHIYTNNPSRGELSGSLYRYSAIDGTLIEKYEGISERPVKGFYKIK